MNHRRRGNVRERKRRDGTTIYQARWWDVQDASRPIQQHKTFATREAAELHLLTVVRSKIEGRYQPPSDMTVGALVDEYIARAGARISERTQITYRQRAETMIYPTIGKRRLDSIAPLDVQRWIDGLVRDKFAPSTIHAAVAVLMGALREAALLGLTERHLGHGVRRPSIGHPDTATWGEAEVRRVLLHVRDDPIFGALYYVAIATGMRPGELRALCWDDVDLEGGTIVVRRTITRDASGAEIIAVRTKSKKARAVAIAPVIAERLRWHRARQHERQLAHDGWQKLNLVFDRGDGHWLYQSQWQRFHVELCIAVGVPKIRMHDLRHTSASLELATGTHPKIVSDRLGHSDISMTLNRYSHVSGELQRTAATALSDRLFGEKADDSKATG